MNPPPPIPERIVHKGIEARNVYITDLNEKRRVRSQEVYGHPGAWMGKKYAPSTFEEVRTIIHATAEDIRQEAILPYLDALTDLRAGAANIQRDSYTVAIGQLYRFGLITEEQWQAAIDAPRKD